uniref:Large ribosomal subunit protein bL20c n=2 Tax=Oryza TaxID=4527 RepID=A0A0E0DU35_9ORYZ
MAHKRALARRRSAATAGGISPAWKQFPEKKIVQQSRNSKMNKGKIFKLAKGFRGRAKNCIRIARERVEKALQYSYRDRRNKKRDMRSLWIERINAGTRLHGVNYGNFMHGLMKENIQLNRKVLSELSMHEPYSFKALVDVSRTAFPGNRPVKEGLASIL